MLSSRRVLTLTVALVSQLWVPGLAVAQGGAAEQPNTPPPEGTAPAAPPAVGGPSAGTTDPTQAAPADQPAEEVVGGAPTNRGNASGSKEKFGEEIVVTGSRIRRKDLTTPAPVTVLSREQVQASGKVSIGDFLQSLPEQGNAINTAVNNGGDGATRVNLRSLGAQRTLVLLNGRRFVPGGTGADSSVDLNSIPTAAIERIEVLKDGASAVYGSDAIGGVVNVITRRKYDGTQFGAYTGRTTHGDGTTYDLNATTGTSGERGNILFTAGYYKQQPVFAGARDFSRIPLAFDATGDNSPFGEKGVYSVGSGTVPQGTFSIASDAKGAQIAGAKQLYNDIVQAFPTATKFIVDPTTPLGFRAFIPNAIRGVNGATSGDAFNFQPDNYLVTPQQRIQLFSTGDTKLGDVARGYFEASYVNRQSDQQLAAEPLVIGPGGSTVTISKDSIYNPFGVDVTSANKRLQEFGNRRFNQDLDTFRVVGGVDGTLSDAAGPLRGWFWDISLNYGRTQGTQLTTGSLRVPNLQNAVGPSFVDPATGVAQCGTPGSPIAGCVPLNLFGGLNSITPAMVNGGLTFAGTARGTNQMTAFQVNTSGELFPLLSDRPVGLAVGYEFRRLVGSFIPDPISAAGETTGNQVAAASGAYNVNEGYGELSIPIVNHMPFAENLEATVAARVFNYSTFGTDWTYKFGGRWSVVPDVTFRGTYSTAFRAPSIQDLFLGQQDNFAPVSDPCAVAANAPASCGSAAGNNDDRQQIRSKVGGNPAVRPETAKVYTAGIVLEPRMVRNLTFTVDYYHVKIDQAITSIGEATILSACYPGPGKTPAFCDLVQRDGSGRINNIINLQTNVGSESESGIDLAMRYSVPTPDYGRFGFVIDATWLKNHDVVLATGDTITGRGNFDLSSQGTGGIEGVNPAWKFNAGLTWGLKNLGAGVSTKFIGSFKECGDANGDFSGSGLCFQNNTFQRKVDAYNTYDAFVSYTLPSPAGRTNLGFGVQNIFDKKPSVIFNGFLAASDPTSYDFLGRFMYLRLTHDI
jgi:iron complex outermembrane recepter protein